MANRIHSAAGRGFVSALCLVLLPTFLNAAPVPVEQKTFLSKWEEAIKAFEHSDKTNPPPTGAILFIGSSSIRFWKTLAQDFPGHQVINRGFGGSHIIDSVVYADRIVTPYRPKMILFYAGGNDINSGKTPEQVLGDFCAFVAKVHATLPETRMAYISIAPNPAPWAQVDRVKAANRLIENFTKTSPRLKFIDVFPKMLGENGQPRPDIFLEDRLHMNAKGYELWTSVISNHLK